VKPVRSPARPERHFVDSLATIRLTIARVLLKWLPRCPLCHRRQHPANPATLATPPPIPAASEGL
jgi:hypothetical protein